MSTPQPVPLAPRVLWSWRTAQAVVFAIGVFIWLALIFAPWLGLNLLWNVLIPVAPLLLLLAPGLWRNLCPLATVALLPRKLDLSRRRHLRKATQERIALAGVFALYLLVPLRHVVLDLDAAASALFLAGAATTAFAAGWAFEWKSGWCAGLCPVRPVETLYGNQPLLTVDNAHCSSCEVCTAACPDSTAAPRPGMGRASRAARAIEGLMFGAFPGFIWGWFHVPHYADGAGWGHLDLAYGLPLAGGACTWLAFHALRAALPPARDRRLLQASAVLSLATYYFYRLPALIGFGLHQSDGVLVDLSARAPEWTPLALQALVVLGAAAWFLLRGSARRSWQRRPPFASAARMDV